MRETVLLTLKNNTHRRDLELPVYVRLDILAPAVQESLGWERPASEKYAVEYTLVSEDSPLIIKGNQTLGGAGVLSGGIFTLNSRVTNLLKQSYDVTAPSFVSRNIAGDILALKLPVSIIGRQGEQPMEHLIDLSTLDPDRSVGRMHAEIRMVSPGKFVLSDLGSKNGTWIGGMRLPKGVKRALAENQKIQFGDITLIFRLPKGEAHVASPVMPEKPIVDTRSPRLTTIDGHKFELISAKTTIGRADPPTHLPDVDLTDLDRNGVVSRRHAEIIHERSDYFVVDKNSSNGTFLTRDADKHKLKSGERRQLRHGDHLLLGGGNGVSLEFRFPTSG